MRSCSTKPPRLLTAGTFLLVLFTLAFGSSGCAPPANNSSADAYDNGDGVYFLEDGDSRSFDTSNKNAGYVSVHVSGANLTTLIDDSTTSLVTLSCSTNNQTLQTDNDVRLGELSRVLIGSASAEELYYHPGHCDIVDNQDGHRVLLKLPFRNARS